MPAPSIEHDLRRYQRIGHRRIPRDKGFIARLDFYGSRPTLILPQDVMTWVRAPQVQATVKLCLRWFAGVFALWVLVYIFVWLALILILPGMVASMWQNPTLLILDFLYQLGLLLQ